MSSWQRTFDLNGAYDKGYNCGYETARKEFERPTVQVTFRLNKEHDFRSCKCPNCGNSIMGFHKYCGHCGAKVVSNG